VTLFDPVHTDLAVARRILAGDEAAFRSLFDYAFPRLYRYALSRLDGDPEAARDVVQQAFCRAIERLDGYRGEAALYTWLFQVCRSALADHYRARGRERRVVTPLEDLPQVRAVLDTLAAPPIVEPETGLWRSEVARLVQATVDALPDRYADVLEWKYVDGCSVRTIAERLGISDKAAESTLTRAREAFRAAITDMAGDPAVLEPPGRA
jgi:RNA polymerase sigma-70 factor (ECF subfamily)